jgi:hypothetical protein
VLEFEPFDTEFKAQKILNLSLKYKLDQQYRSVHAVVAMKKFKHRKYAATIRWFAAADATQRLIHVINRALQQYLEDGELIPLHTERATNTAQALLKTLKL